jgi:hypothetical protein
MEQTRLLSLLHTLNLKPVIYDHSTTMNLWDWSALSGDDILQRMYDGMYDGLGLIGVTLVATIVFELFSLETVQRVWKQPGGPKLYVKAVVLNVFNPLFLGVPLYAVAAVVFVAAKSLSVFCVEP